LNKWRGRTDERAKRPVTRHAHLLAAWRARCGVSWHRFTGVCKYYIGPIGDIFVDCQSVRLKVEIHKIQFSEVTNYRNPPALDGVCLRMALLCCHVQSSTLHSERRHTSKSISLGVN